MKGSNRAAKGARLEKLAKEWYEALGIQVQLCPNQVVWVADKKRPPTIIRGKPLYPRMAVSVRKDFFGIWDGIGVETWRGSDAPPRDSRFFFQVTVWDEVARKRKDIVQSGFPCNNQDTILGYVAGRNRHFKIVRGPEFAGWTGECLMPPRAPSEVNPPAPDLDCS